MKKIKIIGCGISGVTLANKLANKGWHVDIYDKNPFVGGNCYDLYDKNGILIHKFGPHIFHTNFEEAYEFINKFTKLNSYVNKVLVSVDSKTFPLPINFESIKVIMGKDAQEIIDSLKKIFQNRKLVTLFELQQVREPLIYKFVLWVTNNVYLNYSAKMWGTKFENIDPNIINRVKIVLSSEHNYFPDDKYQGLPIDGFTKMISRMLDHPNIHLHLNVNVSTLLKFEDNILWDNKPIQEPIVYCGSLDELLDYKYGVLPYRSLKIEFETVKKDYFQEAPVVNYPSHPTMTRITEYKKMTFQKVKNLTTISKEYPNAFDIESTDFNTRYYPIQNKANLSMYEKYKSFFSKYSNFYSLGRLAQYKYFDIDDAIMNALQLAKELSNA